jgi:hypothetical protein
VCFSTIYFDVFWFVLWCGAMFCGVLRCGAVWCGVLWCVVVCCGVLRGGGTLGRCLDAAAFSRQRGMTYKHKHVTPPRNVCDEVKGSPKC